MKIGKYLYSPASFLEYDMVFPEVFDKIKAIINKNVPSVIIEHVGSTAIQGCGGKGIIDLAVLYKEGELEIAKGGLRAVGFQNQISKDPFPESRPMLVGSILYNSKKYKIHAHVIQFGCDEHYELIWYREHLNQNTKMCQKYEEFKKKILVNGSMDSLQYCYLKGPFIEKLIRSSKSNLKKISRISCANKRAR